MKNARLIHLNFREVLHYGGQPAVACFHPQTPTPCTGYCVNCEDSNLLTGTGFRLNLMSHGCDSSDFEAILGPMPGAGVGIERPILFLLEDPGGDYKNGRSVSFRGFAKSPPVHHYYWTPEVSVWPASFEELQAKGNWYGPYFAYLIRRHRLKNVYITNLTKCKAMRDESSGKETVRFEQKRITQNCAKIYLRRELEFLDPQIAFCFGGVAHAGLSKLLGPNTACKTKQLYHPAARMSRARLLERNDQ